MILGQAAFLIIVTAFIAVHLYRHRDNTTLIGSVLLVVAVLGLWW